MRTLSSARTPARLPRHGIPRAIRPAARVLLWLAAALALLVAATGLAQDMGGTLSGSPAGQHHDSPHFRVFSPDGGLADIEFTAEMCEEALARLSPGDVGEILGGARIFVRISPNGRDFEGATGLRPHGLMALAYPGKGLMVLNTEALRLVDPGERFRTIGHEMVHLLLGRAAGDDGSVPLWLHEGLAQLVAGQHGPASSLRLAWARLLGRRLRMTRLIGTFPLGGPGSELAYAQSADFTQFVATEYFSFDSPEDFFRYLIRDPDRSRAIFDRLGNVDFVQLLEARWRERGGKLAPALLIATSSTVLWFLVVLLFIAAYLRKRRRQREVVEEWEPWEREDE